MSQAIFATRDDKHRQGGGEVHAGVRLGNDRRPYEGRAGPQEGMRLLNGETVEESYSAAERQSCTAVLP